MMRALAHGIDIVELAEFERLLREPTADISRRCFTQHELEKADDGHLRTERLAARFAAKEAVLKALGTGWVTGINWKDIELRSAANGVPSITVSGEVQRLAGDKGISSFLVSLSHSNGLAIASVIAIGSDSPISPK